MTPSAAPITGFYFLYFATVGILLPFLPAYLKSLDLSASEVGVLLGVGPTLAMVAPPLWAYVADRTGRPDRVLSVIVFGAGACFVPILYVDRFGALLAVLAASSFFATSVTTLLDTLSLRFVAERGGSYARLRLYGSLGFVVSASAYGFAVDAVDRSAATAAAVLLGAQLLWSFALRVEPARAASRPRLLAGLGLLRRRDLALLLAASCLHWIALAPYHGLLAIHVRDLGLAPWVVGAAAGLGVLVEVGVMAAYPRIAERVAPRHVLFIAFAMSALRWAGMSLVREPAAIVALSLLHGLTFGAFFVASVTFVAARVPPELRATGQGLFVSVTFGLGGLSGYVLSGAGYDLVGGHALFAIAAALEVVPAALALALRPRPAGATGRGPA